MTAPLAGIVVVEANTRRAPLAVRLATQFAGKIARDLGARVIRLEDADDPVKTVPPMVHGASVVHRVLSAHKELITLHQDVRVESELGAWMRRADAVIGDDGLTAPSARHAVFIRISMSDPRADDDSTASEFTVMARSGMLDTVGDPACKPLKLGGYPVAFAAGLSAYAGLAAALLARDRGRSGAETVRVNLLDTASWINWKNLASAAYFGGSPSRQGRSHPWQVLRCADGWIALIYMEKDWEALKLLVGDPRLDDGRFASEDGRAEHARDIGEIIEVHFRGRTRADLERDAQSYRLPIGAVWAPAELSRDAHYVARETLTTVDLVPGVVASIPRLPVFWNDAPGPQAAAGNSASSDGSPTRPLAGYRVLDLGILTAGAATSALLADLGADVIKIESAGYRDPFRAWPTGPMNDALRAHHCPPFYRATNRNKRSLCLDLKHPAGRDAFLRLARNSDLVVENFRRGTLEKLGIAYGDLCSINHEIILASLSSQGEEGPDARRVSFGSTLEATSGLAWITGYLGTDPVISGQVLNYADQVVAIFGAGMIVTALLRRRQLRRGAHLELSQRELMSYMISEAFVDVGRANPRSGNAQPPHFLQECYRSADGGWIALTVDADCAAAIAVLAGAVDAHSLDEPLARWIGRHDARECCARLSAAGITNARVLDGVAALGERNPTSSALVTLGDGTLVKGFPFQLERQPLRIDDDAHALGADSLRILAEVGGYTQEEAARLVEAGIVCMPEA